MTEVKTIKCEIHCQNGESLHAAFPAVPGIWAREEIGAMDAGMVRSG